MPADRRGVGVHELGERALPQRAEADQREEQHQCRAVAAVGLGGLRLERVDQPHEPRQLLGECALGGRRRIRRGSAGRRRSRGWPWAPNGADGTDARVQPVARYTQSVARYTQCDPRDVARTRRRDAGAILELPDPRPATAREEPEPPVSAPRPTTCAPGCRRSPSPTSTGCAAGSTGCGGPGTRRRAPGSGTGSPPTSPPPRRASPAAGPPSRRSATPTSCRSASGATTSPPRCATPRSSSSPARPARARPPSCPRSPWSSAAGVRGRIGHTQPRRIAARSVAERIAEELGHPAGRGRRLQDPVHRPRRRPTPWSS